MKKIIAILLSLIFVAGMATVGITAEGAEEEKQWTNPSGNVLKFNDVGMANKGNMGYAVNAEDYIKFQGDWNDVNIELGQHYNEKGITVAFDVMVSEILVDRAGMFSQISVFMNNDVVPSYAGYNFTLEHARGNKVYPGHSAFECWTGAWPAYDQTLETNKYAVLAEQRFDWQLGEWYRMAIKYDKNKASVYLNGELMCESEFEMCDHNWIIMFPQYCTAYFDNFVTATAAYDVTNENWENNPEVYDFIDFENAVNTSAFTGVQAGDWDFSGGGNAETFAYSGYNLAKFDEIEIPGTVSYRGDANADAAVNLKDANAIIRKQAGYDVEINEEFADVNGDGKVNLKDASAIIRVQAGWENTYDVGGEIVTKGKVTFL